MRVLLEALRQGSPAGNLCRPARFSTLRTICPAESYKSDVSVLNVSLFAGKTLEEAADVSLGYMKSKLKGLGGVIVVSKAGDWAVKWTSAAMPWAAAKDGKLHSGIDLGETSVTDLP